MADHDGWYVDRDGKRYPAKVTGFAPELDADEKPTGYAIMPHVENDQKLTVSADKNKTFEGLEVDCLLLENPYEQDPKLQRFQKSRGIVRETRCANVGASKDPADAVREVTRQGVVQMRAPDVMIPYVDLLVNFGYGGKAGQLWKHVGFVRHRDDIVFDRRVARVGAKAYFEFDKAEAKAEEKQTKNKTKKG